MSVTGKPDARKPARPVWEGTDGKGPSYWYLASRLPYYYFLSDGLGSVDVVVDATGVIAAELFAPYGQARWAGGTMPTSYAFTGQRADSTTGLDYYGARYYDPAAGTFTSADTALGNGAGLNRYAYVACNPETLTDPTGHDSWWQDEPPPSSGECLNDANCDNPEPLTPPFGLGNPGQGTPCGSKGQATCSSGGADVSACFGKGHCIIFINGGCGPSDPCNGTNGFGFDIGAWQKWIDKLYAEYGGDVGFILMETNNSDAQQGADLIHETLASLGAIGYTGHNSIIAASAGADALFIYLDRADTGQYGSDASISSFIAMDAGVNADETKPSLWNVSPCLAFTRFCPNPLQTVSSQWTHWNGDVSGAADYVRKHGIKGLYVWARDDFISSEVSGGGAWETRGFWVNPIGNNTHTYLEQSPDRIGFGDSHSLADFLGW